NDALDTALFKKGGGDGDGVTQEELEERVPVLQLNNFLVGGTDGNEQRGLQGSDLGYSSGTGLRFVSMINGAFVNPYPGSTGVLNTGVVIRTSTGQGKF